MSIFSWFWHVIIPSTHVIKLPHLQGRPVPPHRRPRRRRASCPSPSRSPAFLQPRSHGWLARCGAITAFQGVFWSVGGSIVRHERPRGQRAVPTARGRRQGNVKRSFHGVHCLQDTTAVQSPRRGEIFCRRGGIMAKITSCGSPSRGKRCSGTALLQGSVCTRFGTAWTRP